MIPLLKEMISNYVSEKMEDDVKYINQYKEFSKKLDYKDYVEKKAIIFNPGHMWNVERFNLGNCYKQVAVYINVNREKIDNCKSFDEIIKFMSEANIKNFGELAQYDKALAMGIYRGMMPNKIYVHAGPRKALKYILGDKYKDTVKVLEGTDNIEYIDIINLPNEFKVFQCNEYLIEICLCYIHSKYLSL